MATDSLSSKPYKGIAKPWVLYVFSCLFTVGYILFIIDEGVKIFPFNAETTTVSLLFFYYLAIFVLSWFREKTAGYLFISWYVIEMALVFYVWTEAGMVIVLGFPVLPIGVFYVLYGERKALGQKPSAREQWKLVLRSLMIGYAAIFIISMPDLLMSLPAGRQLDVPYIFFSLLSLIFITAFVFSFKQELLAGLLLVAFYIFEILLIHLYPGLQREVGPFGWLTFPLLIQGFLYIAYWNFIRPRRQASAAG
jgi:hypothetical protein